MGGMGGQCPGAPELKGAPTDREKMRKGRSRKEKVRAGARRVRCPRAPNILAMPLGVATFCTEYFPFTIDVYIRKDRGGNLVGMGTEPLERTKLLLFQAFV